MRVPDGRYRLRRDGGLLPPLRWVAKEVRGPGGATRALGVPLPFTLEDRGDHVLLRYRPPLAALADRLVPVDDARILWRGEALVAGRRYARFTMRRVA